MWGGGFKHSTVDPIFIHLIRIMERRRIPQIRVAELSGYDIYAIRNWFQDKNYRTPQWEQVKILLEVFELKPKLETIYVADRVQPNEAHFTINLTDPLLISLFSEARSKGYTVPLLAERFNCNRNSVTKWLNGSRPIPYRVVRDLAQLLGYHLTVMKR